MDDKTKPRLTLVSNGASKNFKNYNNNHQSISKRNLMETLPLAEEWSRIVEQFEINRLVAQLNVALGNHLERGQS